jgi:hypothetical protein
MELFNDDHYPLSENWTRMKRLSDTAFVFYLIGILASLREGGTPPAMPPRQLRRLPPRDGELIQLPLRCRCAR